MPQKIQLFKKRDFTDKINVTIEFIRQNFLDFFKPMLYLLGPISIITGLVSFQNIRSTSRSIGDAMDTAGPIGTFSAEGFTLITLLIIILSVIGPVMTYSLLYNYLKLYNEKGPGEIKPGEVINRTIAEFPSYFALGFIVIFITIIGTFLCLIPGIYLGVTLSFCGAIYAFEKGGVTGAIERSFQLIKDNWWETFGLVIITFMLGAVITIIFDIPIYVFFGVGMYTVMIQPDITLESSSILVQVGVAIGLILAQFGKFLSYIIPLIALSFQYFHVVEEKESVGLLSKIEKLDVE